MTAYIQKVVEVEVWLRVDEPEQYFNINDCKFSVDVRSLSDNVKVLEAKIKE